MSVEKEKKPRKAPAKKAVASSESATEKKVKTAAPKAAPAPKTPKEAAPPKKKVAAKSVSGTAIAAPAIEAEVADPIATRKTPPTHAQIAERAYFYFVERGWKHGFHDQDWLRAEQELWSGL